MDTIEQQLVALERQLNPAEPTRAGVQLLAYGEVSAVLGLHEFPDRVFKRMSGFPTAAAAADYAGVVEHYVSILRDLGVNVAATDLVQLEPTPGRHVVYAIQPRLDPATLGHALLRRCSVDEVLPLVENVLATVQRVLAANACRSDGREIAVDAQLSNWNWSSAAGSPHQATLVDVSTPFMRKHGTLEVGVDVFLRAYPSPVQWWMRRTHAVEQYIDDYFNFQLVVCDLIGNFIKEGVPDKVAPMIDLVNQWISRQPDREQLGHVDEAGVRTYYRKDAATLELSLRARRVARLITTKILRRRYDFILPGHIKR